MGIKKKNKVSAEFSMSSLTDIIFLLLIFFMLTSSSVMPNALSLKLPGRKSPSTSNNSKPARVDISQSGTYYLNDKKITFSGLSKQLKNFKNKKGNKANLVIAANPKVNSEKVIAVMDLAYQFKLSSNLVEGRK